MSVENCINNFGKVQLVKCTPTFMWTINNFCACRKKIKEPLISPIFSMGSNSDLKWSIHLYPKGFDEKYQEYISLFLKLESCTQDGVKIKYKFSIFNDKKGKSNEVASDTYRTFNPGYDWGFREFIKRDALFNEKNNFLPDNNLTIFCEIDVKKCKTSLFGENITFPSKTINDQGKLLEDLEKCWKDKKHCDVTFIVNDQKFYAHKAILAGRSKTFLDMFETQRYNKPSVVIEINDFNEKIFKEILHYIYTGVVEDLKKIATDLLPAANKYQLEELKSNCADVIRQTININNVADILIMADMYNANKLKTDALNFIIINGENFGNSSGFKKMIDSQPHLIAEAFQTMVTRYTDTYSDILSEVPRKKRKSEDDCSIEEK